MVSGVRSAAHAVLFLAFFCLGFIRKWKSRSNSWTGTTVLRLVRRWADHPSLPADLRKTVYLNRRK